MVNDEPTWHRQSKERLGMWYVVYTGILLPLSILQDPSWYFMSIPVAGSVVCYYWLSIITGCITI